MGKVPNWECLFVHREQGLFLSAYMDHIKVAGKKQKMAPMWKKWMTMLILMNQLHVLTTNIWDALNVNANQTKSILNNTEKCSNHVFLLDQLKNYHGRRKPHAKAVAWSHDMLEHSLKHTANWRTKRQSSCTKFQVLAWIIINSRRRSLNQWRNYPMYAHKLS